MENTPISQGAEAKIFLHNNNILKSRTPKSYRHPNLDQQIRTRRTRSESKILTKALQYKINVPKIIHTNKYDIQMQHIKGDRLSQTLNSYPEKKQLSSMQKLGRQVAKLHANNIIHSDLTTSNVILSKEKIFLIDFGLSYISTKIEDKAVDLHLIKQALQAKHFQNADKLFQAFKKGYKWQDSKKIIDRLIIVERRGRYKH
jgi:TP53 regulating kinase and related kinases